MQFKRALFSPTLVIGFFLLTPYGFSHDGENHDDKGDTRGGRMLFDEGSGSSAMGEYEKRHDKPQRVDQFTEEGSGGQRDTPAFTAPRFENESGYGSTNYDHPKENYKGRMEEGSGDGRGFPTN